MEPRNSQEELFSSLCHNYAFTWPKQNNRIHKYDCNKVYVTYYRKSVYILIVLIFVSLYNIQS